LQRSGAMMVNIEPLASRESMNLFKVELQVIGFHAGVIPEEVSTE